ncbi:TetR/AcrR family transcriptional regulator [Robertkochia aurantiaca]|uniref:TetR/AcrR family transcriptional regulator n=1 Tax=Robertkochia aurantiaca TaxID=2873700 RepID=UPI001CCD795E|nr:TetR/AcrR family transcriptional regulator [Robertkochia sp. 3YJGBD-33]
MRTKTVKERLIETASDLFYKQGFNRTGINQILEESGVAKASMYQNFRSKEELGVAYLQRMDQQMMENLKAFLDEKEPGRDRVLGIFDFIERIFHGENFRGCWSLNTLAEIPVDDEMMREEIVSQKNRFRLYLRRLIDENLEVHELDAISDKIYLLYEASLMESALFKSDLPIKRSREMAELLLDWDV